MAATCVGVRMMEAAVSGLLEHELSEGELGETIRALREHGALRGEASSAAVSGLLSCCNSRLLSAATRTEGLSLLSLLVEESSTDVFQQHCVSWIRSVLQVIQSRTDTDEEEMKNSNVKSQDPPRVVSLAVFVLRSLLAHSSALPELSREISTNQIPGLLTSLLGLRRQCLMPALEGIRSCLISYPRACGSLRGKLTSFFLSLLDEENVQVQELACQCFSLLPSLGSGFTQGIKHTENWERQIQSVLCSLHAVFQQLYQTAETETTRYEGPGTELDLPVLDEDDGASSILQLARRFSALGQCVRLLLREQFPAPVRVPVSDILNLVCRAVNVSAKNLSWQGDESLKLLLLPRVHKTALDILEATILACGPRLLPFSSVICRLFPQVLSSWASVRNSAGFPSGQEKPYSSLRGSVYQVLERWVTMCGVSCGILQGMSHHSDVLLAHLLSDVTPPADSVKMSGFVQLGAKKQKVSEVGNGEFQSHRKRENSANTELCTAALRVLCSIFLYGGSLIKEDTHRRLQELSIPLLIRLQQGPEQWVGPYANSECRKQLYRLLLSLTLTPCPRLPPPLHCAVRIFRLGLTEENLQVSMFCAEALAICRVLIHPRSPSLQRPLPQQQQHGPRPPVQADVPAQRPPAPPITFPTTIPVNHLPIRTLLPPQPTEPPAAPSVPSPHETFGGKTPRPIFIHYEKEEMSDVEISLESDSDDSIVIVPEGLLQKPAPKSEPSPPSAKPPTEETSTPEVPVQPVVPSPTTVAAAPPPPPPPPPAIPGPSPAQMPVPAELPPPPPQASAPSEGDMVININSTDEEEEDEDEEGMYDDEEEEEYYDEEEEEDLEGLEDEEEDFEDDEGMTEEEEDEEEEDLDAEGEEDEGEEEDGLIAEDLQMAPTMDSMCEPVQPLLHNSEPDEGPPRLSPVQDDDGGDTGLLMLVESEEREVSGEGGQDRLSENEVTSSPSPPPILSPPQTAPIQEDDEEETVVPDVTESEPVQEAESPAVEEEPIKEIEEEKKQKPPLVVVGEKEEEEDAIEETEDDLRDAESMLADFIDCPPDDDKDPTPLVT